MEMILSCRIKTAVERVVCLICVCWLADRGLSLKVRAQVYNLNDLQKRKDSFVFVDSQQRQKKVYFVLFSTTKFLVCVQKHYVLKITYVSVKPFVAFCM